MVHGVAAGEYEVPCAQVAPAFTIAGRNAPPEAIDVNPVGPADYYIPAAFPAGPAYSMPQATLLEPKSDEDALPGATSLLLLFPLPNCVQVQLCSIIAHTYVVCPH